LLLVQKIKAKFFLSLITLIEKVLLFSFQETMQLLSTILSKIN
jgi:hypothetical protein